MRKTAKKTQVETSIKAILAANTEDLKTENHNKFKNQVTKTGANHQPVWKTLTWRLWRKTSIKPGKTGSRTPRLGRLSTRVLPH
jgi:hypothetical protein